MGFTVKKGSQTLSNAIVAREKRTFKPLSSLFSAFIRTNSTTTRDRNLQFRGAVSTGGSPLDFFAFSPGFMCNLVGRAPENLEKVGKNPVEKIASNPVTSVAVMVFSAPSLATSRLQCTLTCPQGLASA